MSCESIDEAVNDISPARLHFVPFRHDFRIFFGGVLIETFMLNITKDDAFEEAAYFVLGEIIWKFAHFIQKIDIFIKNQGKVWF